MNVRVVVCISLVGQSKELETVAVLRSAKFSDCIKVEAMPRNKNKNTFQTQVGWHFRFTEATSKKEKRHCKPKIHLSYVLSKGPLYQERIV